MQWSSKNLITAITCHVISLLKHSHECNIKPNLIAMHFMNKVYENLIVPIIQRKSLTKIFPALGVYQNQQLTLL
jgi:hypothetical protein